MASNNDVMGFFAQANANNDLIVQELPKLDLDLYIQNYTGRTRYDRLLLIGKTCVPLCVDALKAAVQEAKKGSDVTRYKDAWDCIRFAAPNDPEAQRDEVWIEAIEKANKAETSRLESELKGYKNNLIKESIRMGHEDLGRHFESIGKLNEAADAYSRMRQDVSTTKHIIDCGMHLVSVSLQRRDWAMALSNIGKITGVQNGEDDKALQTYSKVVSGLSYLGQGNFLEAAQHFLLADFDVPPSEYSDLASPNDIAVYGGLLALATMDRGELQRRVLENQSFRTFLENEPHIRKAVSFFVNGRYSNCLSILESSRSDFKLDIYLQKHIADIYSRIRSKCIEQYFIPFSCVTLDSLDAAFARPGESVEDELVTMIRSESLKAKIDAKNRLLVAVQPDARAEMQKNALKVALKYEKEATERLRRMSIVAAGLEVTSSKKDLALAPSDESWYDENRALGSQEGMETIG